MEPEKLANLLSEARVINAVDNVIFPLLEKLEKERIEQACGKFRGGKAEDFVADIAYVCGLQDIRNALSQKQKTGNREYEKLNQENE